MTRAPGRAAANGDLAFIPLGGTGEIGMNLNLYRCDGAYIAIDCGIGFGTTPEVDVMMPDPTYIAERRKDLRALIITHAHEDHIGALAWLWPRLGCPVYGTAFALAVARRKLAERGLLNSVRLIEMIPGQRIDLAPFDIEPIHVAHSIVEACALAIRTPHGTVLHTGDWKLDPTPLIGPPTDEAAFARLGEEGVLALVCDSTNALVEGHSGSEADVRRNLATLIRDMPGRVAVTCFATNVARMESIALAAKGAGRKVALVGRSLRNIAAACAEVGYLQDLPPFLDDRAAGYLADDEVLLICAGSQGEPRSALARIAADTHQSIALGEGDTVIFSAREIPGNERAIQRVQDDFARRGVDVMTADDHMVHVSGHPARDELKRLYRLVKPRYAIPTHGEFRHLAEHADLAEDCGSEPILLEDGDVLRLGPGAPKVTDSAPVGRLVADGDRLLPINGAALAARRTMLANGTVVASLAVDASGKLLAPPQLSAPGLFDSTAESDALARQLAEALGSLPAAVRRDDEGLREAARGALRRAVNQSLAKRPTVEVHLLRLGG
jgi:ribonuclease J